ncbi:hypothetical protein C8Q77DRAFT_1216248 [Trametes polyzona]|nr:hypothetical protein C8Q77DRAFT_1216248 [Trametes polyzona]
MRYTSILQRIHKGLSTVELVHTSHPRWPLPPHRSATLAPTLHISVLDSSFNPPTLAHLALANTLPPPPTVVPPTGHPQDFDARLLLLSVRNVDKKLKPGDATYEQRMAMMVLLAHELARTHARNIPSAQAELHDPSSTPNEDTTPNATATTNVAVAIIDEPTFVGKSSLLLTFLTTHLASLLPTPSPPSTAPSTAPPAPKLTFLMGTDTVARLFAPRYYPSDAAMRAALTRFLSRDGDDAHVVCARRTSRGVPRAEEERVEREMAEFARTIVPHEARLAFVDIGEDVAAYSSSEVRELRAEGSGRWRDMVAPNIAEYIVAHDLYVTS